MIKPFVFSLVVCLLWAWPAGDVLAQGKAKKAKKARKAGEAKKTRPRKTRKVARASRSTRKRSRKSRRRRDRWPPMHLEHMHTREQIRVRLFDRRGRAVRSTTRRLRRFLRCHRTGRKRSMNWRLVRNLYKVSRLYKGKKILIYSAYRHRSTAALKTSRHIRGQALDIAVQGVRPHELRDQLRSTFKKAGVGYYPHVPFVHFDVRKRAGFWVDVSGSGESSRYVASSHQYIKDERKYGVGSVYLIPADGVRRGKPTQARIAELGTRSELPAAVALEVAGVRIDMVHAAILRKTAEATARPVQGPPPVGPDATAGASNNPGARKKVAPTARRAPTKRGASGSNKRSNR